MNKFFLRTGHDLPIYLSTIILSTFGIIMIGSATITIAISNGPYSAVLNIVKQVVFVGFGYIFMFLSTRFFKVKRYAKSINALYVMAIVGLLGCLFFPAMNGAKAWIRFGTLFTIQPSEFSKLILILLLAHLFTVLPVIYKPKKYRRRDDQIRYNRSRLFNCLGIPAMYAIVIFLIVAILQKDFGSAFIILLISLLCFFTANNRYYIKSQTVTLIGMVVTGFSSIFVGKYILDHSQSYQLDRIRIWLDPLYDPIVKSYQLLNALIAFANGGWHGVGLGNSTQKYGYIPESHNDFIGSIIYEELGIFGLALIIIPYYIIISRLIKYSLRVNEAKSKIILMGIASYFFFHLFINLGGISGLIPMTGVPLLLVSYGGSSIWSAFIAIGIAQSVIASYHKSLVTSSK